MPPRKIVSKDLLLQILDTRKYTFSKVDYSFADGTQISIVELPQNVVVTYRETDPFDKEPSDTWSHVSFSTSYCHGQEVQSKYLKAVEQTVMPIVSYITKREELHNKPIIFYGHSLGGALAHIAGLLFKNRFNYMFSGMVVSTGATRVFGWFSPTKELGYDILRLTHDFDWAGLVMPWFKHGVKNIQIGKGEAFTWMMGYERNSHAHHNYVKALLDDPREVFRI